jgi:cell division protease FtsH
VGYGGGNDEREQTLNQLLVEMDGFEANEGIIIVAATNRPDVLDPALLRPGRFDRQVQVPNPDIKGRERILGVHARKVPLGPDVDLRIIARGTPGFSGADLANLVNEAALMAARVGRRFVTMDDFENAKDKVMMGAERRSMVMTEDEEEADRLSRGGARHRRPERAPARSDPQGDDHPARPRPRPRPVAARARPALGQLYQVQSKIAMAMGGKVAEELVFGKENVTSGAASDIQQVSPRSRARWSRSSAMPRSSATSTTPTSSRAISVPMAGHPAFPRCRSDRRGGEAAGRRGLRDGAKRILTEKRDDLERLAKGLLEYETLTGSEIQKVINGEPLNRGDDSDDASRPGGTPSITAVPKTKKPKSDPDTGGMEPEPTA